jgi:hypothetical protein
VGASGTGSAYFLYWLKFILGLLLQVVIFESRVKTPQVGLYALAKALSQKGVAKKIQVQFSLFFKKKLCKNLRVSFMLHKLLTARVS